MKCRVCGNTLLESRSTNEHVHEPSPIVRDMCVGCWLFSVQMETFLFRASERTVLMGNWTEGWMKAIIADPGKYR